MAEPTIIVSFGDGVSGLFIAEVDDVLNIDADGEEKTTFYSGDDIFVRVHYDSSLLKIASSKPTDGEVFKQNTVTRESVEEKLFETTKKAVTLTYKPSNTPIISPWYGRESITTRDGREMKAVSTPCLGKITYDYRVVIYRWRAPEVTLGEDETWPMALVFEVEDV